MNLLEWRDATNPKKVAEGKRAEASAERARVLKAAGTTAGTIDVRVHHGRIGESLLLRLEAATAGEKHKIKVKHHKRIIGSRAAVYEVG